ncbi:hypothetical protein KC992_02500 [Candidatus Saccharibacteria bacterium]|nr:hypothetical protein [Candidatus Saccharibacteria bacterium]MCA9328693.1 hypothetical protein [Candidatus Saccharibacteria bacterium]
MLLSLHILIASFGLLSSIFSAVLYKKSLLNAAFTSIVLTILSGIGLVVFEHVSFIRVCSEGLLLSGISLAIALQARKRIAALSN